MQCWWTWFLPPPVIWSRCCSVRSVGGSALLAAGALPVWSSESAVWRPCALRLWPRRASHLSRKWHQHSDAGVSGVFGSGDVLWSSRPDAREHVHFRETVFWWKKIKPILVHFDSLFMTIECISSTNYWDAKKTEISLLYTNKFSLPLQYN